jgi:hypothetical protein
MQQLASAAEGLNEEKREESCEGEARYKEFGSKSGKSKSLTGHFSLLPGR